MTLQDRVVLVTGGAKRIGRIIALALAKRGANVVFTYLSSAKDAAKLLNLLKEPLTRPTAIKTDISRSKEVRSLIERIRNLYGRLDILVNSAATFDRTPFETLSETDWDNAIDINLKGQFLCSLYASRLMLRQGGGGKIINIADWAGVRPYRDYLPYCVSKAGVIGLTKSLAKELSPSIQVNAIAPGPILPPSDMTTPERRRIAKRVLLKRWGNPQDVANAVLFLIEGTDFMTGSVIFVDGGQLIA